MKDWRPDQLPDSARDFLKIRYSNECETRTRDDPQKTMIQRSKLKCADFASADFEDATIMTDSIKTTDVEEAEGTLCMQDALKTLQNMT